MEQLKTQPDWVVRCSDRDKPLSDPLPLADAERLADYYNDNQGEDYCLGDHYVVKGVT